MKSSTTRWLYSVFFCFAIFVLLLMTLCSGCATTSDQKAYYDAALAAQLNQKPLLLLEAKDGEKIELSGVKTLAVYPPMPGVHQYVDPWAGVVRDGIVAVSGLGAVYLTLDGTAKIIQNTGAIAGRNINYGSGSYQGNTGAGNFGSPNSAVMNAGGSPSASPATSTYAPVTTSTTDNHQTGQ